MVSRLLLFIRRRSLLNRIVVFSGRSWNMSDSEGESEDSAGSAPSARRILDALQRRLARHHHALEDSDRSDDGEDVEVNEDEYESDDFLVRSGEEDEAGAGEQVIWSDDGDSEIERKEARRAAKRRRQRRQEGEVIDLESETEDEEESGSNSQESGSDDSVSDSDESLSSTARRRIRQRRAERQAAANTLDSESSSRSGSNSSEEEARPPVPFVARATAGSESSSDDSEEEAPPPRRKKRIIEEESEESS